MTDDKHNEAFEEIDCLEAIEQLYAYLDGELDDVEVKQFEHHLGHCRSCFSRKELETELSKKLRKTGEGDVPESLQSRLKDLIEKF